jgi:hypothetical protein
VSKALYSSCAALLDAGVVSCRVVYYRNCRQLGGWSDHPATHDVEPKDEDPDLSQGFPTRKRCRCCWDRGRCAGRLR